MKLKYQELYHIRGGICFFLSFKMAVERMIRAFHIRYLMHQLFED